MNDRYYPTGTTAPARPTLTMGRIATIVGAVFILIITATLGGKVMESVDASEIVLIQSLGGDLSWHTQPGWAWQGFGKVTRYNKRGSIRFQPPTEDGAPDNRLPIVFNDAGKGVVRGSMNYELPMNDKQLTEMHSFYPNMEGLESGLIKPALNKSVYLTGTLMTSFESVKERRSSMIQYVEDQTQNGVYRVRTVEREVDEETIGPDGLPRIAKKKVSAVEVVTADGRPVREETGQLSRFGVKVFNFAIEELDYEESVDKQVSQQQTITMAVQTSIAKAKQAVQDAVTAEATGRANVATARAQEEIGKTQAVVAGEKARDVARLKAEEAVAYKTEQLLRADADSEYRRRIMQADNALTQRLEAYKYGVDRISTAIAQYQGQWTPSVMIGGGTGSGGSFNAVQNLIDLALVNQAKQLGLDLAPSRSTVSQVQPAAGGGRGAAPVQQTARR